MNLALFNLWFLQIVMTIILYTFPEAMFQGLDQNWVEVGLYVLMSVVTLVIFFAQPLRKLLAGLFFSNNYIANAAVAMSTGVLGSVLSYFLYQQLILPDIPTLRGDYYWFRVVTLAVNLVLTLVAGVVSWLASKSYDWDAVDDYDFQDYDRGRADW